MCDLLSDLLPDDFVKPPYSEDIGKAVSECTMESFDISTDGTGYFLVNGKKYLARKVALVFLRRFAARNDIRNSISPHHSLRRGTQKLIVDEIIYKWARRQNGTEDPWLAMKMEDSINTCGYDGQWKQSSLVGRK
jgi:hypothetical protein